MRFTYFLLVATATLLSSCNASAAVSGDTQAKLSTMTSTDAAVPAHAVDASNVKRFLRSHHDEDEEERVNEPWKLGGKALKAWKAKWAARAEGWLDNGHDLSTMKAELGGQGMSRKNAMKYYQFVKKYNERRNHGVAQPLIFDIDSIRGACYVAEGMLFAYEINSGASFNPELAHEMFGEDPYLTSVMGASYVRGLHNQTAACVKHFIAYSKTPTGHDRDVSHV
ncbi:hypothetical protein PR003_g6648 [Phytophthora rubi]|uniref:RxLR effector protein n=1 Tax=Phytophthora rubi TaxID=129364 RepID=A0A6A3J532_9STRA|nr:hypothetical protein PR001_g21514 [Phytophthora rubi]KAE9347950.1 hypothetical protein PR003_g6648 [Phytophthora rubi]